MRGRQHPSAAQGIAAPGCMRFVLGLLRALSIALILFGGYAAPVMLAPPAVAQSVVPEDTGPRVARFAVPSNKSQTLRVDRPFTDLLVGNPEIADVLALTDRTIYVLGRKVGSTRLTISDARKRLIAVVDLVVTPDVEELKTKLHELLPNETIEVRAVNDSLVISGTVSSAGQVTRAAQVAERYAPEKVTNFLRVRGSQQVLLQVRFAEVQRTVLKDLGFNTSFAYTGGDLNLAVLTTGDGLNLSNFAATAFRYLTGNWTIDLLFDALEQKGAIKTLARPNLIALSGDTANFLAGGEFPIPVAQSAQTGVPVITIEFKEFGVSLAFTPTVLGDDLINLVVAPEVSAIDPSVSITLPGNLVVPGLVTRRAKTTVELRDGQSFAIAGLLQNDFRDQVRQFPWLGDVPVLGALFRSANYQRRETELVLVVTPRLVKPVRAGTLTTAADRFVPPTDKDLFAFGRVESPQSGTAAAEHAGPPGAGGIIGSYGHILK